MLAAAKRRYKSRCLASGHQSYKKISIGFQFATQPRMIRLSLMMPLRFPVPSPAVTARAVRTHAARTTDTDQQRLPTYTKQLVEIATDSLGAIVEIPAECLAQLIRMLAPELVFGRVNNDLDWLISRKLARPADDVFLRVLVEVPLAKRERIERVEQLGYFLDPQLNHVLHASLPHFAIASPCGRRRRGAWLTSSEIDQASLIWVKIQHAQLG